MAHEYKATVAWKRGADVFTDLKFSRAHEWSFDGGVTVPASASPHVVRAPFSRAPPALPTAGLALHGVDCGHHEEEANETPPNPAAAVPRNARRLNNRRVGVRWDSLYFESNRPTMGPMRLPPGSRAA